MSSQISQKEKNFINAEHIGSFAEVDGERIHYLERGEGETVLLIHSLCQSLYTWHSVFYRLSERYRVVAVDLPGMGYSSKLATEESYLVPAVADRLVGFMDVLGIDFAHLIAFSTGAIYALEMAERYPARCGRLVLTSPGGIVSTMPYALRSLDSALTGWFFSASISKKKTAKLLTDAFFDRTLITADMVREYYKPLSTKEGTAALRAAFRAFNDADVVLNLREVKSEVLILWGVDDRWRDVASAEVFHIALPLVEFALVRNCGHILHEEKRDKFLDYAIDFIETGIAPTEE